ncbi:MAG: glycosyltransferase family 2 protein [Actinomycetes bacterium]
MPPTDDTAESVPGAEPAWPGVSIVMPVRDEERHLRDAVLGILEQRYPGRLEIVLAVGPSRDRTGEVAASLQQEFPDVRLVDNPTGRTPAGLNIAISATTNPVVVRVDGHGRLPPGYITTAVRLLEETGADNVGGMMVPEGVSGFEQAVARAMTSRMGIGGARFHVGGRAGPAETVYLGVFRRSVLERLGGFNESFVRAQDWELNHRIRAAGGVIWFSPDLRVTYRPRSSLRALARQFFHTGRWRREVVRLYPETASLRFLAPPVAVVVLAVGTAAGLAGLAVPALSWGWVAPGGYTAVLLASTPVLTRGLPWRARAWFPVVVATMHVCWGTGFLLGSRGRPS